MTDRRLFQTVALILSTSIPLGCSSDYAPIPGRVGRDEMGVYTAWLEGYRSKHPSQTVQVFSVTFPLPFGSDERTAAHDRVKDERKALRHDGVMTSGLDELASLGNAYYPLPEQLDPKLAISVSPCFGGPCPQKRAEDPNIEVVTVSFSRVAFSHDGKTAFLHAALGTTHGDIHYGGTSFYMVARKSDSTWRFRQVGPTVIS